MKTASITVVAIVKNKYNQESQRQKWSGDTFMHVCAYIHTQQTTFFSTESILIALYNNFYDFYLMCFPSPNYSLYEDKDNVLFSTVLPVSRGPDTK